ncbi:MAG: hypothetical protein Q7S36_00300 [Candidatus Liptonbacteria bacterium]|nr:hypothetical protein [Candidatus Liptonbacteria bacterium]
MKNAAKAAARSRISSEIKNILFIVAEVKFTIYAACDIKTPKFDAESSIDSIETSVQNKTAPATIKTKNIIKK